MSAGVWFCSLALTMPQRAFTRPISTQLGPSVSSSGTPLNDCLLGTDSSVGNGISSRTLSAGTLRPRPSSPGFQQHHSMTVLPSWLFLSGVGHDHPYLALYRIGFL